MHPSGCSESAILLTARVSRLAFFLMKGFVEPFANWLGLNEKISEKIRNKRHYFAHCVWFLDPENAKDPFEKIWDYQAKILYCDLLHGAMFHDNQSCRKTTSLSFIVLPARNLFPLSSFTAESLLRLVRPPQSPPRGLPKLEPPTSGGRLRPS